MRALIRRLRTAPQAASELGASAVEYGLLVAAIAVVIGSMVFTLGKVLESAFSTTCSAIQTSASIESASCDGPSPGTG